MKNLFTPRTPRTKFFQCIAFALLSNFCTIAQSQKRLIESGNNTLVIQDFKLELISEYQKSIKIYYYKKWKADRKEFEIINKKEFWQYMPSVGIQFGLPSVQWNPYQIFQAKKDKETLAAKLESIDYNAVIELNNILQQMANEHYKLQILQKQLSRSEELQKTKIKYFQDFYEVGYLDKTITPEEYRKELIQLKENENRYLELKDNFAIALFEFQKLAKYQFPNETFPAQELNTQNQQAPKRKFQGVIPERGEER